MNISISAPPEPKGGQFRHLEALMGAAMVGAAVGGAAAGGGAVGAWVARIAFAAVWNEVPKLAPSGDRPVMRATAKRDAIIPYSIATAPLWSEFSALVLRRALSFNTISTPN